MFEIEPCRIPGLRLLRPRIAIDRRGRFVKLVHEDFFAAHGMRCDFREQYYSVSRKGVLRGFHFQVPPAEHAKLVTCLSGQVLDAVIDLRRGSPSFGEHCCFDLSDEAGHALYIPAGCGHAFLTRSATATLLYNVTSIYSPPHDAGIRWDSACVAWPIADPILSERDSMLPALADFDSPFEYQEDAAGR